MPFPFFPFFTTRIRIVLIRIFEFEFDFELIKSKLFELVFYVIVVDCPTNETILDRCISHDIENLLVVSRYKGSVCVIRICKFNANQRRGSI